MKKILIGIASVLVFITLLQCNSSSKKTIKKSINGIWIVELFKSYENGNNKRDLLGEKNISFYFGENGKCTMTIEKSRDNRNEIPGKWSKDDKSLTIELSNKNGREIILFKCKYKLDTQDLELEGTANDGKKLRNVELKLVKILGTGE